MSKPVGSYVFMFSSHMVQDPEIGNVSVLRARFEDGTTAFVKIATWAAKEDVAKGLRDLADHIESHA